MSSNSEYIPAHEIDRRLAEIEELLKRLPIELEMLKRLRGRAIFLGADQSGSTAPVRKLGPKKAVLRLLRQDGPATATEIVDHLEAKVESGASDIRRTLFSTITNLKIADLIQASGKKLSLTPEGEQEV